MVPDGAILQVRRIFACDLIQLTRGRKGILVSSVGGGVVYTGLDSNNAWRVMTAFTTEHTFYVRVKLYHIPP